MIEWLLKQIEKDPTTLFRKRDLLDRSPSEFERLKQRGLLVYVQTDPENETYPCNLPCARACPKQIVEMQGRFYAMCPEDSEIDPVLLGEDDLHKYSFSVTKLLEEIRGANRLGGSLSHIEPDYHYLGYATCDERRVGLVFVPSIRGKGLLELCGLRRACIDDDILIVLSPVNEIGDAAMRAAFRERNIVQVRLIDLLDTDTFKLRVESLLKKQLTLMIENVRWIRVAEAAEILRVNTGVISRWATEGKLQDNGKKNRERRVSEASVLKLRHQREEEDRLQDAADELRDRASKIPHLH